MSTQTGTTGQKYWWRREEARGENGPGAGSVRYWWKADAEPAEGDTCAIRPRPGHLCPECGEGTLAYNGLFLLTCPECHHVAEGGANF